MVLLSLPGYAAEFKGTCKNPVKCDSVTVVDHDGHVAVTFSNGLGFTGNRIDGDGPLFFSDSVVVNGKSIPIQSDGHYQGCRFYFTDHGTFTQGWESRLTIIECNVRLSTITTTVTFNVNR